MSVLNSVDYIIIVLAIMGGILGAIKGFIDEVSQKCGYVIGFALALMFTANLSKFVASTIEVPSWVAALISYVVLFLIGFLLTKALGNGLEKIFEAADLSALDNIFGFLIGIVEAAIIIGIVETVLFNQNLFNLGSVINDSLISATVILPVTQWILYVVQGIV